MKKYFTFLSFLLSIFAFSQDYQFEEVVKVDSTMSKDKLFSQARSWVAHNFKSIVFEDKEMGEISASGLYDYRTDEKYRGKACVEGPVKYSFTIYIKEGRYKYIFSSFDHKGSHGSGCRPANYGVITTSEEATAQGKGIHYNLGYADVKLKLKDLVENKVRSLKSSMSTKYEGSEEW